MGTVSRSVKRWLINGVAITIPLVVTVMVLLFVLDFVLSVLSPVVAALTFLWPREPPTAIVQSVTLLSLLGFFLAVGFVAERTPGERLSRALHGAMETIPVVSTVYLTVRRASDILVDDDTDQFKEVKLVEFPHENAYTFGFLTSDTPELIEATVGEAELQTVMVPLGPNPTTNGFVMHLPRERLHDVDVTVEEAIRSIATLGVATDSVTGEPHEGT